LSSIDGALSQGKQIQKYFFNSERVETISRELAASI
jgi:hypothetical protein